MILYRNLPFLLDDEYPYIFLYVIIIIFNTHCVIVYNNLPTNKFFFLPAYLFLDNMSRNLSKYILNNTSFVQFMKSFGNKKVDSIVNVLYQVIII